MVKEGLGELDKSGIAELTFPGRHAAKKKAPAKKKRAAAKRKAPAKKKAAARKKAPARKRS